MKRYFPTGKRVRRFRIVELKPSADVGKVQEKLTGLKPKPIVWEKYPASREAQGLIASIGRHIGNLASNAAEADLVKLRKVPESEQVGVALRLEKMVNGLWPKIVAETVPGNINAYAKGIVFSYVIAGTLYEKARLYPKAAEMLDKINTINRILREAQNP